MGRSTDRSLRRGVSSLARLYDDARVTAPLEAVSFWAAVALPVAYLPLLFAGGLRERHLAFALLAVHVIAVATGHTYGD